MPLFGETFVGPGIITANVLEAVCSGYWLCTTASVGDRAGGKAGFLQTIDGFFFCISDIAGLEEMTGAEHPFSGGDVNPIITVSPGTLVSGLAGDGSGR